MEVLIMDKDSCSDYDNFDYQGYYNSFDNKVTRGPSGELENVMFIYEYDSHL